MNDTTAKTTITIKKYANRRLYNTATSSYVTLEDLSVMVKEGIEFNVYDAKTSEDITRAVLTQIIVEEEGKSGQQNLLPIGFLRQLIGFYGDNMQWMVPKYLEHSMQMFSQNQEQVESYFHNTFGSMFPFGTTLEEMGKQNIVMFERALTMFSQFTPSTDSQDSDSCGCSSDASATSGTSSSCCMNKDKSASDSSLSASSSSTPSSCCMNPNTASSPSSDSSKSNSSSSSNTAPSSASPSSSDNVTPMPAAIHNADPIPTPNVTNLMAATSTPDADDMQQKIANLQRQLADLAKNRA